MGGLGIPWTDLEDRTIRLDDLLSGQRFEREGGPLASDGLYVALEGHGVHCFQVT